VLAALTLLMEDEGFRGAASYAGESGAGSMCVCVRVEPGSASKVAFVRACMCFTCVCRGARAHPPTAACPELALH
jgi:hypothetical protein